jgi:hypothetical protein
MLQAIRHQVVEEQLVDVPVADEQPVKEYDADLK